MISEKTPTNLTNTMNLSHDETALDWLRRVNRKRKQVFSNPIASHYIDPNQLTPPSFHPKQYRNWISLTASTFFMPQNRLLTQLQTHLQLWRRIRRNRNAPKNNSHPQECKDENLKDDMNDTRFNKNVVCADTMMRDAFDDDILQFFPKGTGIPFLDETLSRSSSYMYSTPHLFPPSLSSSLSPSLCPTPTPILEITGPSSTGKTFLLMSFAVNYIVATCIDPFLGIPVPWNQRTTFTTNATMERSNRRRQSQEATFRYHPLVILLDPEYSVHMGQLSTLVRTAVIKRWHHTEKARQAISIFARSKQGNDDETLKEHHLKKPTIGKEDPMATKTEQPCENYEWIQIEKIVAYCLGRIQITQPRDTHSIVATLELIRHSLDLHHGYLQDEDVTEEDEEDQAIDSTCIDSPVDCDDEIGRMQMQHELIETLSNEQENLTNDAIQRKRRKQVQADEGKSTVRSHGSSATTTTTITDDRFLFDPSLAPTPPTMLLFDSVLSSFDSIDKMYENLPMTTSSSCKEMSANKILGFDSSTSTGLSGKNDFMRQLKRLLARHSIFVASTRTTKNSTNSFRSPSSGSLTQATLSSFDEWNKVVTHRIHLQDVIPDSKEAQSGFDFVALLPTRSTEDSSSSSGTITTWTDVFPFSITENGLRY